VPEISRLLSRMTLISGRKWWSRPAWDPPPMKGDSC
jgi:hypothetical protein